jgi:hypothetical protein
MAGRHGGAKQLTLRQRACACASGLSPFSPFISSTSQPMGMVLHTFWAGLHLLPNPLRKCSLSLFSYTTLWENSLNSLFRCVYSVIHPLYRVLQFNNYIFLFLRPLIGSFSWPLFFSHDSLFLFHGYNIFPFIAENIYCILEVPSALF